MVLKHIILHILYLKKKQKNRYVISSILKLINEVINTFIETSV
jgi:hypothetical protein